MMLEVAHIDSFYGETQVLFDVSLVVGAGEVVALLGANGAGKTTTLRSILGLTRARGGAIRFDGVEITRAPAYQIARAGIGWVPDDRRIFPTLTVERNLAIARKNSRFRAWQLGEIFEIFSALEYLMPRECENLSGGEMQMVALARAARRPRADAARRALPGPRAQDRAGRNGNHPSHEGRGPVRPPGRAARQECARGVGSGIRHGSRPDRARGPVQRPARGSGSR
jgi:ABC-type transport system involved in cytochrome c biogenesis ATPase subunit